MRTNRIRKFLVTVAGLALVFLMYPKASNAQAVSGKISGTVTDQSGGVLPDATIVATNAETGVKSTTVSNSDGAYAFPILPIGTYNLAISKAGFQTSEVAGIKLNAAGVFTADVKLQVGAVSQAVTVEANPLQVQTSDTQLGTVITGNEISNMPLINRNALNLMQTEPGVMASNDRFGTNSVNGSQTQQNSYLINGTDFNDIELNDPLTGHLAPNPDAMAQFSVVDSTLNPEYGRNSGAIVNQVVKSGTNAFHGSGGEFYRDTFLNARDAFSNSAQVFHRNIFDGTIGGPVIKNHLFFFGSYEGLRQRAAATPVQTTVYSAAQLAGNFGAGFLSPPTTGTGAAPIPEFGDSASTCPVSGGVMCAAGTAYSKLFSTGNIPTQDFNVLAKAYVTKFNPAPTSGTDIFAAQFPNPDTVNQEMFRIDETINASDSLWGYGYIERENTNSAIPFGGGNVPGFASTQTESISNYTVAWNHVFSASTLNELRVGYTRFNFKAVEPLTPVLPSSIGFAINPQEGLTGAGLPFVGLPGNDISLGFTTNGPQPRIDQNYQLNDNFSHIMGNHDLKFGIDIRRFFDDNPFFARNNGGFTFGGAGTYSTGDPFADLLLGFPDSYNQTSGGLNDGSAQMYYSYAQDSWKARRDLTVNYGLAWSINTPYVDHFNNNRAINCFRPGEQSAIFPTAPVGLVFPGDANCSSAGYPAKLHNFGPRLGFAWSPSLGRLSGRPGDFSIRASAGIYYDQTEEEGVLQNLTAPPFSISSSGFGDAGGTSAFQNPFVAIQCLNQKNQLIAGCTATTPTGTPLVVSSIPNKFPFTPPQAGDKNIDFANFSPMSLNLLDPHYGVPYAENYNLTVQRQIGTTIITVGYVGSEGRHTERALELNPLLFPLQCANTPACLDSVPFQFESPVASSFYRFGPQTSVVSGNPIYYASLYQQQTDGNSNYNSLQASAQKSLSNGLNFLLSYTWSHANDDSSSLEDQAFNGPGTNGFIPALNYGASAFDARQRFVASFSYTLPFPSSWTDGGFGRRALKGWRVYGITTAQTGFPFSVEGTQFTSLTCDAFTFFSCPDNLQTTGAPVDITSPRGANNQYFNPNAFQFAALGTFGDVARNALHGPGIWNTDLAVFKDTQITERTTLQLRIDASNAFNHVQFDNPNRVLGGAGFGDVPGDTGPRIVQLGARFIF